MTIHEQLKRDEGLRRLPYKDVNGNTTIGYGRNLSKGGISEEEAELLLQNDILNVNLALVHHLPWITKLDDARRGVLTNMGFNIGIEALLEFKSMLERLEAGNYKMAAHEMLNSRWSMELPLRSSRLAKQMETGIWQ